VIRGSLALKALANASNATAQLRASIRARAPSLFMYSEIAQAVLDLE